MERAKAMIKWMKSCISIVVHISSKTLKGHQKVSKHTKKIMYWNHSLS